MRFMIGARAAENATDASADAPMSQELITAYMRFNEELHNAGVLVASEGLNPAGRGARVAVSGGKRVLVDGPFAESKELVGGFYIIEVDSLDEAVAWAMRCPVGMAAADVLDIRPLTTAADLPPDVMEVIQSAAPTWSAHVFNTSRGK